MSSQKYSINQQLILRDRHSGNSAPSPYGMPAFNVRGQMDSLDYASHSVASSVRSTCMLL